MGELPKRTHPAAFGYLAELDLFRGLPRESLELFADRIPVHHLYRSRMRVFEQAALHVVAMGAGKLSRCTEGGRRLFDAVLRTGDVFGHVGNDANHSYELEPLEDMQILAIRRPVFEDLVIRVPALCWRVIERIESRRARLERRVESLMFKDVPARVAELLLDLSVCSDDGESVDARVTQQDMADLVGASRQMVNRVIGRLAGDAMIARQGTALTILDHDGLAILASASDNAE